MTGKPWPRFWRHRSGRPERTRPRARAGQRPGIVTVRGSLAPEGGFVKTGLWDRSLRFSGRAKTFSAGEALAALKAGAITPGQWWC